MPRGKQNNRKCRRRYSFDQNEILVDNPELGVEEAEKLKEIEQGYMRAELKHIDKKFTDHGTSYYAETVEEIIPEQVNWWSKFALCLVRTMGVGGSRDREYVLQTSLRINSQHLKDILKETIKDYPGVSFETKDITIDKPYHALFHHRQELEQAGVKLEEGSEAMQHLDLLLDFIETEFKDVIDETENLLEQGMIDYEHLWTIFKPGCTVYAPVFGQSRAFTLLSYEYTGQPPGLCLSMEYVDFDGVDMGRREAGRIVAAFPGSAKIHELSAYPIDWHPRQKQIEQQLLMRGRTWEKLAGMHFRQYTGIALEHTDCGISRFNVDGRVVVDTKTFYRLNASHSISVNAFKSDLEKQSKRRQIQKEAQSEEENITLDLLPEETLEVDPLTDQQCMLANAAVRGFSFTEKRWFDFFVDNLSPVDWNEDCFDQLVLPSAQKDLVKALVATHVEQRLAFDDIVKGKGKGLIFVLHGPPGVGKTLTAETVAEYCKRPLYMVGSGDLGTESSALDSRLSRILDMASTWKAVLLIDEADVFLERRSLHDMERNSLVSIFLRVLEYYEGILFLTSNRVNTFDEAFKSRIHVPLKYNNLSVSSRKQIWKNFLGKLGDGTVQVDEKGYDSLAQVNINGRQIKNVVRTAKSLAQFHGQALNQENLEAVVQIQKEFEQELDLANEIDGFQGVTMSE